MNDLPFREFMLQRFETGGFTTEDLTTTLLPLMRETLQTHRQGFVAPFEGLGDIRVSDSKAWFSEGARLEPRTNPDVLESLGLPLTGAFEVENEYSSVTDYHSGARKTEDFSLGEFDVSVERPVFLPSYDCWEHQVGHHDPLTDIFSLGMLAASLACRLDFELETDLSEFVQKRANLFALAPSLHPVIARLIGNMTELDRHRRAQDLESLIAAFSNYRDQQVDLAFELESMEGFETRDHRSKQGVVLSCLKKRLFDISKRNRLLNFRQTMQSVNLTQASVPLSFDLQSIRPERLLVWNQSLHEKVRSSTQLKLNSYLNFAEAIYLPGALDRIISEARRDTAEYGMAQLRLVICFLTWSNLKEQPVQQFESPLLLLPVQLKKKKGLTDSYSLEIVETLAEVNPVVRHQFKQLYDIDLPESIDLRKTDVEQFFEYLTSHISASQSGVTLVKVDKPRVDIIHEKAKRKLDQYRRRARLSGKGMRSFLDLDYSYDPANFHPLGVKIFANFIHPADLRLREIIEHVPPARRSVGAEDATTEEDGSTEVKRTFVQMKSGPENPYRWQFDLCNVTLANFKYRKMSLVRDYDALLENGHTSDAFDSVFSLASRRLESEPIPVTPIEERFDVVACDPTQASAISRARAGASYIIQGPPGTGKSQTITNLIADFVAQGKRVLFVCEKRAAIDVVYSRLKQRGLGTLCCLIHDSQTDKKAFVMDLKKTYESFTDAILKPSRLRSKTLGRIRKSLDRINHVFQSMKGSNESTGVSRRALLEQCLIRRDSAPLSALQQERLPSYGVWLEHRETLDEFEGVLADFQADGVFANHGLSRLAPAIADQQHPLQFVTEQTREASLQRAEAVTKLEKCGIPAEHWETIGNALKLNRLVTRLVPFAKVGQLRLLDAESAEATEFASMRQRLAAAKRSLSNAQSQTTAWREKIPVQDIDAAITQAKSFAGSYFNWLSPAWWRLRGILNRAYDFGSHMVQPSWEDVLQNLKREYEHQAAVDSLRDQASAQFDLGPQIDVSIENVVMTHRWLSDQPQSLKRVAKAILKSKQGGTILERLQQASPPIVNCAQASASILEDTESSTWAQLKSDLDRVANSLEQLPDFLTCLDRLKRLPLSLAAAIRQLPLSLEELELAVAQTSYQAELRDDRELARFNFAELDSERENLEGSYERLLDANAEAIIQRQQQQFLQHLQLSDQKASQIDPEQRAFAKHFKRGRRELEHEFGKSMRYKPIRDLMINESGSVVNDLKPVWLMSPLSVSDTLPLETDLVDVVIFDEASQVTLEEAIPTIFRAPQAIVVGDQMQLPPTDFFASNQSSEEDELEFEEAGEVIQYDLNTDSLLSHSARNLPSTMLGWHYRSRSESLISFSNRAFYQGRLLTVPEESLTVTQRERIAVENANQGMAHSDAVRVRPISFHFVNQGVYRDRRNVAEAQYIAHLVKGLLASNHLSGDHRSIGVVAFSEAQQNAIEMELQKLAAGDPAFRAQLELEWEREVDNQFVGLLVKNLENIQGDERDVVILSVCYGPNPDGKMLMNFGPINKSGGEKRLNVAFSRAKQNMCIVSSITGDRITNDYNDGARCLKDYLSYVEMVSVGDQDGMQAILQRLSRQSHEPTEPPSEALAERLTEALVARGFSVDRNVGQSKFRCDLGVRKPGDSNYRLGILLDSQGYYQLEDALERDVMRPKLLEAFGWNIAIVLAKDWFHDSAGVLDRLSKRLAELDS